MTLQKIAEDGSIRLNKVETSLTRAKVEFGQFIQWLNEIERDTRVSTAIKALSPADARAYQDMRNTLRNIFGGLDIFDNALRNLHKESDKLHHPLGIAPMSGKGK
jgi:hypothetical protein